MNFFDHAICLVLFLWFLLWAVWRASKEFRAQHPEIENAASEAVVGFINRWIKKQP